MKTQRRWSPRHKLLEPLTLPDDHPAIQGGRTLFPSTVRRVSARHMVLSPGANTYKLGSLVTKGRWRGAAIFSLSLEERRSCPKAACWSWCYGNHSHLGRRWAYGPELFDQLEIELEILVRRHGRICVRLHQLGDFPDLKYVRRWREWSDRWAGSLFIFGYTRHARSSAIGREIAKLEWSRAAIRFSDQAGPRSTQTLIEIPDGPTLGDVVVCPAQTRPEMSCGACALCWTTERPIGFVLH